MQTRVSAGASKRSCGDRRFPADRCGSATPIDATAPTRSSAGRYDRGSTRLVNRLSCIWVRAIGLVWDGRATFDVSEPIDSRSPDRFRDLFLPTAWPSPLVARWCHLAQYVSSYVLICRNRQVPGGRPSEGAAGRSAEGAGAFWPSAGGTGEGEGGTAVGAFGGRLRSSRSPSVSRYCFSEGVMGSGSSNSWISMSSSGEPSC